MKYRIVNGQEKDVSVGIDMVVTLPNKWLREMLCYHFNCPTSGLVQMKEDIMMAVIGKHMEEGNTNHSSNQKETNRIVLGSAE